MIVGLGNPGPEYADTRHNVGFAVVDALAETLGREGAQRKFGGKVATADVAGKTVLLLKPLTYMNRSGQSVATAVGFYKVPPEQVMVVLDDMDLEPGRIRLRAQGSPGGHHGLEDVIRCLGTDRFGPVSGGDRVQGPTGRCRLRPRQTDRRGAGPPGCGRPAIAGRGAVLARSRDRQDDDAVQSRAGGYVGSDARIEVDAWDILEILV